jgi:hypothetical protein
MKLLAAEILPHYTYVQTVVKMTGVQNNLNIVGFSPLQRSIQRLWPAAAKVVLI